MTVQLFSFPFAAVARNKIVCKCHLAQTNDGTVVCRCTVGSLRGIQMSIAAQKARRYTLVVGLLASIAPMPAHLHKTFRRDEMVWDQRRDAEILFTVIETRDAQFRDRDETETLSILSETRPRRDVSTSRDRDRDHIPVKCTVSEIEHMPHDTTTCTLSIHLHSWMTLLCSINFFCELVLSFSLYAVYESSQLSLAIPPWVGTMSTGESWDANRHIARCTSTVSVVWQCKLVSGWRLMKRRSASLYGPYDSGRILRF